MCSLTEHAQVAHFQKRNKIALQRQHMFAVTENGHALFAFVKTQTLSRRRSVLISKHQSKYIFFLKIFYLSYLFTRNMGFTCDLIDVKL